MATKEIAYLKGLAKGLNLSQTLLAANAAAILHKEQKRKSGDPYFIHPLRVATSLAALGIKDDLVLATALLHDVIEDCQIDNQTLENEYKISPKVIKYVRILTKEKETSTKEYYEEIGKSYVTTLVKISDRCHNVSTMGGVFNDEKLHEYIEETRDYVIPLCKRGRNLYHEYSDQIFVMKYQIESLCETIEKILSSKVICKS